MARPSRTHRANVKERGFSVLEAMVAMAILAAALLPLLALQGQFLRTTESLERAEIQLAVQDLALAHIKALNLDQSPNGRLMTPYGEISWKSTPAAGPSAGRGADGFPSRYVLTLYDVDIILAPGLAPISAPVSARGASNPQNSAPNIEFKLQGLGWHPTRAILDSL